MLQLLRSFAGRVAMPAADAAPTELPRGHLPALDALRGLAIVLVTLYRFGGGGPEAARVAEALGLVALGARGVDLFFVLSGFLITGILFDTKSQPRYFTNFYARRALRIFPLYYAALFGLLVLLPAIAPRWAESFGPAIDRQAWLWLYGANLVQTAEASWSLGPLNHFWSLAIEEHFYLLWPAVIYCLSRRQAMTLCLSLAGLSVLGRAIWLLLGGNDVAAEVCTPLRLEGLVLGGWLALAARDAATFAKLRIAAAPVALMCGCAGLAADLAGKRLLHLTDAVWAMAFAGVLLMVVAAPNQSYLGRAGQSPVLRFFGRYSYAMYVFQLPLIYLVAPLVTAGGLAAAIGSSALGQLAYCGLLFAITTGLAVVSWRVFEKPILGLKRHFGG